MQENTTSTIDVQKPIIEFRGVSKSYGTTSHALSDVNLTIQPGEFVFVVIVGHSHVESLGGLFIASALHIPQPDDGSVALVGHQVDEGVQVGAVYATCVYGCRV